MTPTPPDILDNYRQLVAKVDALCSSITSRLQGELQCRAGCSSCCTAITIFPVEAAAMALLLKSLPDEISRDICSHVATQRGGERCPLLRNDRCLLYEARPLICRTHGLPIIYSQEGTQISDCCPLNLTGTSSLSGADVINLDTLNTLLTAINATYLAQSTSIPPTDRIAIADVVGTPISGC